MPDAESAASLYVRYKTAFRLGNLHAAESAAEMGLAFYSTPESLEWHWRFRIAKSETLRQRGFSQLALDCIVAEPETALPHELHAALLMCRGYLYCGRGDYATCRDLLDRASAAGVGSLTGEIALRRGTLHFRLRDLAGGAAHFEQALACARDSADQYLEGLALAALGKMRRELRANNGAIELLGRAISIATAINSRFVKGAAMSELAYTYFLANDDERAFELYSEAARLLEECDARLHYQVALGDIGNIHLRQGNFAAAIDHYRRALAISRELDDPFFLVKWLRNLELAAIKSNDPLAASQCRTEWQAIEERLAAARAAASTVSTG